MYFHRFHFQHAEVRFIDENELNDSASFSGFTGYSESYWRAAVIRRLVAVLYQRGGCCQYAWFQGGRDTGCPNILQAASKLRSISREATSHTMRTNTTTTLVVGSSSWGLCFVAIDVIVVLVVVVVSFFYPRSTILLAPSGLSLPKLHTSQQTTACSLLHRVLVVLECSLQREVSGWLVTHESSWQDMI
jgi:hypothetical protein